MMLLLAVFLFVVSVVLPIWSFARISKLNNQLRKLSLQIGELKAEIFSTKPDTPEKTPAQPLKQEVEQRVAEPQDEPSPAIEQTEKPTEEPIEEPIETPEVDTLAQGQAAANQINEDDGPKAGEGLEENIASKWFVWIGAAAIALAGVFLVKYIADQGILTPAVRMLLAFVMGAGLALGGEWLRRRPIQKMIASIKPDYVPMALTASGIVVMYVAVYASYSLYNLIGPLFAFSLLALVSLLAFGLSILQGVPVAILALGGGLVTPALVSTGNPTAIGLFGYLAVVILACVAVMRYRPWWWLGYAATAGSALWVFIWVVSEAVSGDVMIIGAFLALVVTALSLLVHTDSAPNDGDHKALAHQFEAHVDLSGYRMVAIVAAGAASLAFLLPFVLEHFSNPAMTLLALLTAVLVGLALIRPRLEIFTLIALGLVLAGFSLWGIASVDAGLGHDLGLDVDRTWQSAMSPQVLRFLWWATGFALVIGAGGFIVASKSQKPLFWLLLSILAPLGLLVIAYLTYHASFPDRNWSFAGLLLAAAALIACVLIHRRSPADQTADANLSLGLYATAVVAGISLTMVFLLKDAWLTVALALQLPAIAWISNQLKLDILRKIAMVIGAAIFVRLAANPFLALYEKQHFLGVHWVLYGYGIPALASHFAAVWFRRQKDDYLVIMLEGLRVIFAVLLISAEIRIFATGGLTRSYLTLSESAMQSIAWLAVAWSRLRAYSISARIVDKWSGYGLFALAAVMTFGVGLLINNPTASGENIGKWPVFNTLLLAYVIPALLIWLIIQLPLKFLTAKRQMVCGVGVLVLLFTYITLETRHVFQGPVMAMMPTSDAEIYAYSVVWLVFAFALLMFGLVKKRPVSRYAALLVLVITVLKVFLSDMNDLAGLWRVASFLGLGLSLVGIGYLYQRFLYLPQAGPKASPDTAPTKPLTKPVAKKQ